MDLSKIPELDANGLRKFAFTSAAMIVILFALLIPWLFGFNFPKWPWIVAAVLVLWGAILPASLNPLYYVWMCFGLLLHKITTPIILGIIFFLVLAPIALIMRVKGRDALRLKTDKSDASHRITSTNFSKEKMEKPF